MTSYEDDTRYTTVHPDHDGLVNEIARLRAENEVLKANTERYRWLVLWLHQCGLLVCKFCQPSAFEKVADWWVLKEPAMIKGDSCVGYNITPDGAIDAARRGDSGRL